MTGLKGKTVIYTGHNRPYLNKLTGVVLGDATPTGSYLVSFENKSVGTTYKEYVGRTYLRVIHSQNTEAVTVLEDQLNTLESKLSPLLSEKELLDKEIESLNVRILGIQTAISVLKSDQERV